MASALSSSVFSASANSLTRICRALASHCALSPADKPRSCSRRNRSRTTSATLMTSPPDASFSKLALYRRDQLGGFLGVRLTQDREHLVQAFCVHNVTNPDQVDVVRGNSNRQVPLRNAKNEVLPVLSLDLAHLHRFDECCAMVRVDNGVTDVKSH